MILDGTAFKDGLGQVLRDALASRDPLLGELACKYIHSVACPSVFKIKIKRDCCVFEFSRFSIVMDCVLIIKDSAVWLCGSC